MKYTLLTTLCVGLLSGCVATNPALSNNTDPVVQHPAAPSTNSYFIANHDLLAAETKWRQHKPTHYRYTLQRSCFCSAEFRKPIVIEVSGNTVTKSTVDGVALALERRADALVVEDLFDIIRKAIDSKAARINVQYDLDNGRPLSISIDQNLQMADEEMHYTASDFKTVTKAKSKAKSKAKKTSKKTAKK